MRDPHLTQIILNTQRWLSGVGVGGLEGGGVELEERIGNNILVGRFA